MATPNAPIPTSLSLQPFLIAKRDHGSRWGIDASAPVGPAKYVRQGASGSASGDDWTNAFTTLPATLVRNTTYYVADGAYGSRTFNTAVNGTQLITIKKATQLDHGTDTGWLSTYGDGQATWTFWRFDSNYWLIDGVTGGGPGQWTTGFGIRIQSGGSHVIEYGTVGNITLQHIDMEGGGAGSASECDILYLVNAFTNISVRYCYLHDVSRTMILSWPASGNGFLIEYCKFARNGPAEHREAWSAGPDDNVIVRYNLFEDIKGTGVIAIVNGNGTANNWAIYGNVFYYTNTPGSGNINSWLIGNRHDSVRGGGPINVSATNWSIYNNTIANMRSGTLTVAINCEDGSNYQVKNNIWYSNDGQTGALGDATGDYNWFYANDSNNTSGANDLIGSGNPFADAQPWATGNWALANPLPGLNVGAPYNFDYLGNIRGEDGVWDRGALEH